MKVELLVPPDTTLLSSMLYEGLLRVRSKCSEDVEEECLRSLLEELCSKDIRFNFTGNDIQHTIRKKLSKEFRISLGNTLRDLMKLLATVRITELRIGMKILRTKRETQLLIGTPNFLKKGGGYSFQIMKADRYMGISSIDYRTLTEKITTYADLSGLALFFIGLASSYVTSTRTEDVDNYYFLFFDLETLLRQVMKGDIRKWIEDIKDRVSEKIKEVIEYYGDTNDEAITLTTIFNTYVLEALQESKVDYTGFRLVKVSREGQTYKVYSDMPLRVYVSEKIYNNKELVEEISRVTDVLVRRASRFVRGRDTFGDGYHAFLALRYLYLFVTTDNFTYLSAMYRELHNAYNIALNNKDPNAGEYLRCFLRSMIKS